MMYLVVRSADRTTRSLLPSQQATPHIAYDDQVKAVWRYADPGQPMGIE
jgi:hypothetical protein